jgi:hypothetical protein
VHKAPRRDFVVRTIVRREASGMPLMSADLVIAGEDTRRVFTLADTYPLHFRKTYFPGRLHGDPAIEFERHARASELLDLPPPIGHTPDSFRSCFLPGTPFQRLSPFGSDPEASNVAVAAKLELSKAAGLWRLLGDAFESLRRLHRSGLAHGDAELHNFIVCPSPLELLLIDFEAAVLQGELDQPAWDDRCALDLVPVLREAVFLQCSLGRQPGPLAELAEQRLEQVVREPDRFRRAIGNPTSLRA